MKRELIVFDTLEQMKWHFHRLYCEGDNMAGYIMLNYEKYEGFELVKWLESMGNCRVKELEDHGINRSEH